MSEPYFKPDEPCQSVTIWSRENMTNEMFLFGWTVFNEFNKSLATGEVCASGCMYSNKFYSAFAKKTKGGLCSVCVSCEGIE